ncbi:GNAT family N-acetyltransferase [Thermus filiformis]|uniref:Acetyltransferase n=1 Tax=Thermus filiformis TaxID=276 RepID=A0A0A2WM42_THEFI|nr:GNAT family N-acetyltransferase [Thermus filiformis]KGQ20888.1 acetyltransferase [Thermus filiformis]
MPQIRPARKEDLSAIAHLSHATALLGEPARFFPSEALWGELFVRPYLERGCCNLVAEEEGRVLGYILGACHPFCLLPYFLLRLPPLLLRVLAFAYGPPGPYLRYLLRLLLHPGPKAPYRAYPAHLHIAVDPEAQGQGLGRRLMEAFLDCLRTRGVKGVQLSTTRKNAAARRLYRSLGFRLYAKRASPFWRPFAGRPLVHEVWVLPLNSV